MPACDRRARHFRLRCQKKRLARKRFPRRCVCTARRSHVDPVQTVCVLSAHPVTRLPPRRSGQDARPDRIGAERRPGGRPAGAVLLGDRAGRRGQGLRRASAVAGAAAVSRGEPGRGAARSLLCVRVGGRRPAPAGPVPTRRRSRPAPARLRRRQPDGRRARAAAHARAARSALPRSRARSAGPAGRHRPGRGPRGGLGDRHRPGDRRARRAGRRQRPPRPGHGPGHRSPGLPAGGSLRGPDRQRPRPAHDPHPGRAPPRQRRRLLGLPERHRLGDRARRGPAAARPAPNPQPQPGLEPGAGGRASEPAARARRVRCPPLRPLPRRPAHRRRRQHAGAAPAPRGPAGPGRLATLPGTHRRGVPAGLRHHPRARPGGTAGVRGQRRGSVRIAS